MPARAPQSTTLRVPLKAFLSSDHVSAATGKTIAVVVSKNMAAFGNPSAGATNATELSNGWYYVDLSTTDTATLGPLLVRGTATGVDDVEREYTVVKATNGGWTAVPDTACTTNASLVTSGTGTDQLSVSAGKVALTAAEHTNVITDVWTTAATRILTAGTNIALAKGTGVTGFNDIAATAVVSGGAITTSGGAVSTVTTVTNQLTAAQVATGVWQDTTASDFTTASSIGKSLAPATLGTVPGAAGGLFIAGTNAATTVNFTGTITTATNLTNLPAIPANWLTAAGITAAALNGKGDWNTTTPPTAAAVATAVWTDATAGDFTTLGTPGKILVAQLGNAFTTTSSSVFTIPALANGPSGSGSSPAAIATAVWQDATPGDFTVAGSVGKGLFTAGNAPGAAGGLPLGDAAGRVDVGKWLGHAVTVDVNNFPVVNVGAVNADTSAASNLMNAYNGVGYFELNAPLSIGRGSYYAASNSGPKVRAASAAITTGTGSADPYNLGVASAVLAGNQVIDVTLTYAVPTDSSVVPTEFLFQGLLTSSNAPTTSNGSFLRVQAYHWTNANGSGNPGYETIGLLWLELETAGNNNAMTARYPMLAGHVGTGGNAGAVRVRFFFSHATNNADLSCGFALVGYTGAAVASVANAVTLPAIPAGWLTGTGVDAGALNGKGDWSTYAGGDTAGTATLLTRVPGVVQPQTGDAFARIGGAGAGLTAVRLAAAGLDSVVAETGVNARQALALTLDAVLAKLSGATGATVTIRDVNDTADRATVGVDGAGNRTSTVLHPPA